MFSLNKFSRPWFVTSHKLLYTAPRLGLRGYCDVNVRDIVATGSKGPTGVAEAADTQPGKGSARAKRWCCGHDKDDEPIKLTKISASARMAQSIDTDTMLNALEPVRMVILENVRSRINEFDQRKLRHEEYVEMLKKLIVKRPLIEREPKLPFKKPESNVQQTLRECSTAEEVLQLTNDPKQLASELVRLASELNNAKRKHDLLLENYLDLKLEMQSKSKSS